MPASIIAAVVTDYIVTSLAANIMMSAFLQTALRAVIGFALSGIIRGAMGGDKKLPQSEPVIFAQNRTVTVKQPISAWQIIYGRVRVGGVITFGEVQGDFLHMVITFAGHECEEIETVYFNDTPLTLDANGMVDSGTYSGYAWVHKSTGEEAGQPFPDLVTDTSGAWSDAAWQAGCTKVWVKLRANRSIYNSGIPNVTAIIKGKKVIDPRISPTERIYSANAALCTNDYLTDEKLGFRASYADEVDEADLIAAANICDELMARAGSPDEMEPRYEINGAVKVDAEPKKIIGLMLGAFYGKAINVGGRWHLYAGAYEVPTIELDENHIIGPIKIQSLVSRRENANGVKGLFTDPGSSWQVTSFPSIASNSYLSDDSDVRIWRDVDYSAFVTSGRQAQRLAKIELLALRQALSVSATFKLRAWEAQTGRTVSLSFAKFGWTSKAFEIIQTRFVISDDNSLAVELTLRETAAAIFDWSTSEEQPIDIAPNTNLPDPFANLGLSNLTATSGTSDLLLQGDGTVVPRIRLRWDAPSNPFISHYEIQFSDLTSPTFWRDAPNVAAPATEGFAFPVNDGDVLNLRARACTSIGPVGEYSYVYSHTVVGKTAPPSDIVNPVAFQNGDVVVFGCDTVPDADLDLVEVRRLDYGDTDWNNGIPTANILRGQELPSASIPQGNWTFLFKARDTSGNYSTNASRVDLLVSAEGYTQIDMVEAYPKWLGELDNFELSVSYKLVPSSTLAANLHTNAELFEQYLPYPVATSRYTEQIIDKGIDASARVYADIVSALGRGVASGTAAPSTKIDYRLSTTSFDGFEDWSVGTANFRYLKSQIYSDNSVGKIVVSSFETIIDAKNRTEDGTYTTDSSGTVSVTFTQPFHAAPGLVVSPQGSGNVTASYTGASSTGFTGYFKSGGVAAAGTASYKATGA